MDVIEQLRERSPRFFWHRSVKLASTATKGMSVVCAEPLREGELIIHIPTDLLVNISTIKCQDSLMNTLEPQELLASELIRRKADSSDLWVCSLPPSFRDLPLAWPEKDLERLPKRYRERVAAQQKEISTFAEKCNFTMEQAQWGWSAVNTRCLHWPEGGMTLAPALDYLNHECDARGTDLLRVVPTTKGFDVTTQRDYFIGDELTFCYGPHENGFLLTEYGFVADQNPWNFIDLSPDLYEIVHRQRHWLTENGYWDDWTLDCDGQPSFRTEVALASIQAPNHRLLAALINGYDDGSRYHETSRQIIRTIAEMSLLAHEKNLQGIANTNLEKLMAENIDILRNATLQILD